MNKAIFMAAALMLAPLPAVSQEAKGPGEQMSAPAEGSESERDDILSRLSRSELKDKLFAAVETVERACAEDIATFCEGVTPGEGRIAACIHAYDDQLSRRCHSALERTASNFERAVASMAETCLNGIQAQCGNTDKIGQCIHEKAAALAPSCQPVLSALHQTAQVISKLRGMPVFSSDDRNVGQVVQAIRDPDGKLQAIQVQVGRFLGIGDKVVTINADQLERLGDRIRLRIKGDAISTLPAGKGY